MLTMSNIEQIVSIATMRFEVNMICIENHKNSKIENYKLA